MVPIAAFHDTNARNLLGGVTVAAGSTADQALERVLDSLIQHPNIAPNTSDWMAERVRQAAYLVFASPDFQVQP